MLELIASILKKHCLVKPDDPLLVAVSGGVDSLCLLDILDRLNFNIIIAHFDHSLRIESAQEAEKVRLTSEKRNREFVLGKRDVAKYADQKKLTIEEASRHARYRFLIEQAKIYNTVAIAVGHNADDQVETILMHLLRGSGMDGLKGMSYRSLPNEWSQDIAIVRPLLGIWREQLDEYTKENNLQPSLDPSNTDRKLFRNRLRHELIPYLQDYNPGIKKLITQLGDTVREDLHTIEKIVDTAWDESISERGPGYIAFNYELFTQKPPGIQRRLIRRAIQLLRPKLRDIDFRTVSKAVDFTGSPTSSGKIDLQSGIFISIELNNLWLFDQSSKLPAYEWPQLEDNSEHKLTIPGFILLPNHWLFEIVESDIPGEFHKLEKYKKDLYNISLDKDKLTIPLIVRSRKPGDFIRPVGLSGHKVKLSDLFINNKIPVRLRKNWPIVCKGEHVVWVPGLHLSYDYQVSENTHKVVQISVSRKIRN